MAKGAAPSFRHWVLVIDAGGDLVGRISGNGSEDEVKKEMEEGLTPSVTLSPVYRLTTQILPINGALQPVQSIQVLEFAAGLDRTAKLHFHVLLTRFAFLSELDDDSRVSLQRRIDDAERTASGIRSNLVIAR